jgi:hypothetical protein
MASRIEIEPTFNAFVKEYGGELIGDIVGSSPDFPNADYLFRKENVVAELKVLTEDKLHDPEMQKKFGELFQSWIARGVIPPQKIPPFINSKDYLVPCQKEIYDIWSPPVEQQLKKANLQIRETKKRLGMESAKGLLLIANDGNFALPPLVLIHILFKATKTKFHSIDTFVFFTVNLYSQVKESPKPSILWFVGTRDDGSKIFEEFTNNLGESWGRFLENHKGIKMDKLTQSGIEGLEHLRFWNQPSR